MFNLIVFVALFAAFDDNLLEARPWYNSTIPNGLKVPHPCIKGQTWPGLGHQAVAGRGALDRFGRDYNAIGRKWTVRLCQTDSDGDGKTNGQELGDPDCVWTPGATPAITDASKLSHPGICEPLDSPRCNVTNGFLANIAECVKLYQQWAASIAAANGTTSDTNGTSSASSGIIGTVPPPPSGANTTGPSSGGATMAPSSGGANTTAPSSGNATMAPSSGGATMAPSSDGATMVPSSGGATTAPSSGGATATSSPSSSNDANWCPAILSPDVKTMELRFNKTHLPSTESILFCQKFTMPPDVTSMDYQIIAWEPIEDKHGLLIQAAVMGCDDKDEEMMAKGQSYKHPGSCVTTPRECHGFGLVWRKGMQRRCYSDDVGIPLGGSAPYRSGLLHMLFDNPSQLSNIIDSSGIRLYYTSKRRPYEIGLRGIGQINIMIPPKTETKVTARTFGNENCSRLLLGRHDRYRLSSILFQMKKLGSHAKFSLRKANGSVITLVDQDVTFEKPFVQIWTNASDAPLIEPGDDFDIECTYNAKEKDKYTFYGGHANDEMCFVFAEIYPRSNNLTFAGMFNTDDMDACTWDEDLKGPTKLKDCDDVPGFVSKFKEIANSTEALDIFYRCYNEEYPATTCTKDCYSTKEKCRNYGKSKKNEENVCGGCFL